MEIIANDKSTLTKTIFSLNNTCVILDVCRHYVKSQSILKKIKKYGYLFFKLESLKFSDPNRSYFLVSNECQKFIISELRQQDYLQNFEILYPSIGLIKITNRERIKKSEINYALSILKEKDIYPITHRLFTPMVW
jgi:hypothetical protein